MKNPVQLTSVTLFACFLLSLSPQSPASALKGDFERPNVLMVMVDDMGYGDYSMAGNLDLSTPHLDAMAERSARLSSFYVSPVCGLTRAALMSGRYPHRVGVHVNGRNLARGTQTLAATLKQAGYATGIFGKWHLGDHYPYRPVDFGFEKSVVSRGGIIGQLADKPNLVRYTDPFLMNDGQLQGFEGYATDVHFDQAMDWMQAMHKEGRPFFAFLAPNAPHRPYTDVPVQAYERLRGALLAKASANLGQHEALSKAEIEDLDSSARYYAMVERIDQNMGRLFARMEQDELLEDTLVLFFSDNGPLPGRFNAGLRGGKGDVYEGGIKTRFFAHWPGRLSADLNSDQIAAHIDLMPTILEVCSVQAPPKLDGVSLWPILSGEQEELGERVLLFEAHQGKGTARQNYAVRSQHYKLVRAGGYGAPNGNARLELYDMREDPGEALDLALRLPKELARLEESYQVMADELKAILLSPRRNEQRIEVGAKSDHPQVISRTHWKRTTSGSKSATFQLLVTAPGSYRLEVRFKGSDQDRRALLSMNGQDFELPLAAGEPSVVFENLQFARGLTKLYSDVADPAGELSPAWQLVLIRSGALLNPQPQGTGKEKGKGRRGAKQPKQD